MIVAIAHAAYAQQDEVGMYSSEAVGHNISFIQYVRANGCDHIDCS